MGARWAGAIARGHMGQGRHARGKAFNASKNAIDSHCCPPTYLSGSAQKDMASMSRIGSRLTRRGLDGQADEHGINTLGLSNYQIIEQLLLIVSSP